MEAEEKPGEAITGPPLSLLKGKTFIGILLFIQFLILMIGPKFYGFGLGQILAYMALPWGFGIAMWWMGLMKYSDLEDMTEKKEPISMALRMFGVDIEEGALIARVLWSAAIFGAAWAILVVTVYYYNFPEPQAIMQSRALPLTIYNLTLVTVSETITFAGIIPFVIGNSEALKNKSYRNLVRYPVSQAAFALFHIAAYWDSPDLGSLLLTSFLFGTLVFLPIVDNKWGGLGPCMAAHAAWNLIISGVLTANFIGV